MNHDDHMMAGHDHHAMMGAKQAHNHDDMGGEGGMECSMQMIVSVLSNGLKGN